MVDPEPSDDDLVTRTAQGDNRAFAAIWQRHSSAAYSVARSYRTLDADDLVAESFAKVLRAILNGGGPEVSFRAYLFTTIRNTAATQLKQVTALSLDRDLDPDTFGELSVEGPDVSADSVAARAFRRMPQRWQQVLWYVAVEGLSPVEAAAHLSLSPNGVSALAMRARKALRREMVLIASADLPADSSCRPALLAKVGAVSSAVPSEPASPTDHSTDTCAQCRAILRDTVAARASLSIVVLIAAIGSGPLRELIAPGATAVAASGPVITEPAALGSALPGSPADLIAAPAMLTPAKLVALTTTIAAFSMAFSGVATGEASPSPEPSVVSEVRDVGHPDPNPPIENPEPTPTPDPPSDPAPPTRDPAPVAPAPDPPSPAPESPGLGNGAAPYFDFASDSTALPAQITGLGTPGWTVEAFVADGLNGFAPAQTDGIVESPAHACPRPPRAESARVYSTGPLDTTSWSLAFDDLAPGAYTVVVVECTTVGDETVASVFSMPRTFAVAPRT